MSAPAFTCRNCASLAKPGEAFCCRECELAWEHGREEVIDRETVEEQRDSGRQAWFRGRRLGLQNSA